MEAPQHAIESLSHKITLAVPVAGQEEQSFTCLFSLKAAYYQPQTTKRAPVDVVFVIDRSSSMHGERIKLVKESAQFMIKNLTHEDSLSIVSYASDVKTDIKNVRMTEDGKKLASRQVENIRTSGCTNLSGGLLRGLGVLNERVEKNEVASVLLFTDGEANEGIVKKDEVVKAMFDQQGVLTAPKTSSSSSSSAEKRGGGVTQPLIIQLLTGESILVDVEESSTVAQLKELLEQRLGIPANEQRLFHSDKQLAEKNESGEQQLVFGLVSKESVLHLQQLSSKLPATVYTFGFGNSHNEELLRAISDSASGVYYFIENEKGIEESFADCLGGLLSVVGQNLQVRVTPSSSCSVTVKHKLFKSMDRSFIGDLGDIQSEEERDILFEITLPRAEDQDDEEVLQEICQVEYIFKDAIHNVQKCIVVPVSIRRLKTIDPSLLESDEAKANQERVQIQRNRMEAAEALEEAAKLSDTSLPQAVQRIQKAKAFLEESGCKDALTSQLLFESEDTLKTLNNRSDFMAKGGKKKMMNKAGGHQKQRAYELDSYSQCYQTSNRQVMKSHLK